MDLVALKDYLSKASSALAQVAAIVGLAEAGGGAIQPAIPKLLPDDGSNPVYDPATGIITEDFYRYGRMAAQKGARYNYWKQAWQMYSMMGWGSADAPMHAWVEVAPDPAHPENDHPTQNARHSWELGWMEAPPADPGGDAERQATWDAWKARVLANKGQ